MAKGRKKDEGERLPGVDWILSEDAVEEEEEALAQAVPEDVVAADLPRPGEAPRPRPEDRPRTGASAAGRGKGKGKSKGKGKAAKGRKKGRLGRAFDKGLRHLRKVGLLVPQDPVERMRFKLRWLGVVKFPISYIVNAIVSILVMIYLWYLFLGYDMTFLLYSKHVSVLLILVPACIGLFALIYFGLNVVALNRLERRMTATLEDMLAGRMPPKRKGKAKGKKGAGPKEAKPSPSSASTTEG